MKSIKWSTYTRPNYSKCSTYDNNMYLEKILINNMLICFTYKFVTSRTCECMHITTKSPAIPLYIYWYERNIR